MCGMLMQLHILVLVLIFGMVFMCSRLMFGSSEFRGDCQIVIEMEMEMETCAYSVGDRY